MSTSDLSQKSKQTRRAGEFGYGPGRQNVRSPSGRSSSSLDDVFYFSAIDLQYVDFPAIIVKAFSTVLLLAMSLRPSPSSSMASYAQKLLIISTGPYTNKRQLNIHDLLSLCTIKSSGTKLPIQT